MPAALGAVAGCGVPPPRPDPAELWRLLARPGGGAMATGTPPEPLPPELVVRPRRDSSGEGTNESPNGSAGAGAEEAGTARTGAGEPRAGAGAGAATGSAGGGDIRSICRHTRNGRQVGQDGTTQRHDTVYRHRYSHWT